MDPNIFELLSDDGQDEVEAIIRLRSFDDPPAGVRIVARFGDIATCRLRRQRLVETWADEVVSSLKAKQVFALEGELDDESEAERPPVWRDSDRRRPDGRWSTGKGTIVAAVDWGFDFGHDNFRNHDGSTRIIALWDQTSRVGPPLQPYGYGCVFSRQAIDNALRSGEPYDTLGYHPGASDRRGRGCHGTHVLDIAAGNGRLEDSITGLAPDAGLLLVHLSTRDRDARKNLGDSVTLLEALDWIRTQAGDTPFVINLSVGRHGGPHNGLTLCELAIDQMLTEAPGRCVVQSAGNYYSANVHAGGRLRPGGSRTLRWRVDAADITPNELEVWYSKSDALKATLEAPDGGRALSVPLGGKAPIEHAGQIVGRFYHRARDPSNGDHHINIFLYPQAPAGVWRLKLEGEDVVDGRYNCWVERDSSCARCQSRLDPDDADPATTTGTICNGRRSVAVGAYDRHDPERKLARFSSSGPTVDGRVKPDLVAPGVCVWAAKSTPRDSPVPAGGLTANSGTSMAAPHVTGCVAAMFEAAGRPLAIHETRLLLLSNAEPAPLGEMSRDRSGSGYLDVERVLESARRWTQVEASVPVPERQSGSTDSDHNQTVTTREEAKVRRSMTRFEGALEEASWPDAESLLEAALDAEGPSLTDVTGDPASVAAVFDSLCGFAGPAAQRHFERFFEVVAMPGEGISDRLQSGDIVIGRAFGEGGLGWADPLVSEDLEPADGFPGEPEPEPATRRRRRRRWRRGDRLRHNVLVVRPRRGSLRPPRVDSEPALAGPPSGPFQENAGDAAEGLTRAEVRDLQQGLNAVLGTSLAIDGDNGRRTREAVRQFQRQAGLVVDGIAGSRTLAALRSALARVEAQTGATASLADCRGLSSPTVFDRFELNRDEVPPAHTPLLRQLASCIVASLSTATPVDNLDVVGHTDPVGSDAYNLALGRRRAEKLAAALRREIEVLQPGASSRVVMNISSAGETQRKPGAPELSRRVEVHFTPPAPPPPVPTATIEVVTDDDNDFRVDRASPVATFVRFGLWDNAYTGACVLDPASIGDLRLQNGADERNNFVGSDQRRFYFRVADPAAQGRLTIDWKTLRSDRSDDDAPASQALTLNETAPGSGVFVSRAVMLVTDDTDAAQATHSGSVTGLRNRGQSDHRLRRAAMDGFVHASYRPSTGSAVEVTLPVFERTPNDERLKLRVRVINYNGSASAGYRAAQFQNANRRWNQIGLQVEDAGTTVRPAPAGMLDASGVYQVPNGGAANSAQEQAALRDLIPITSDNTVTIVFVPMDGANAYATVAQRNSVLLPNGATLAMDDRYFIFIDENLDLENFTLAHELAHVLFNRFDGTTGCQFFTLQTQPATVWGVPLPDVRIRRRIQDLHSPDSDNDPQNDNIINWARRRRTARFPIGGGLGPPTATTGNLLVENLL